MQPPDGSLTAELRQFSCVPGTGRHARALCAVSTPKRSAIRSHALREGLSRAEVLASALFSTLAGILCCLAARSAGCTHHVLTLVDLACACGLIALALTPRILFGRVRFQTLRHAEPVSAWTSCAFAALALFWFAYAAKERAFG